MNHPNKDGRFSQDPAERRRSMLERYNAIDPKNRGVIVVDTCSLFSLAGKALQDKHYFDILTFLSEHGYKVVIPDIVAFETARVLPNGKCLERYYKRKDYIEHSGLVHFMEEVATGKHPNMSIVHTEEPAHIGNFIEGLVEITNLHPPGQKARQLIRDHLDKHRNRHDWGDDAIREIVKKLPSSPPVHVLTQDYKFLNGIGLSMPDLNVLTSFGLLLGIAESGLNKVIPYLDHSANANELLASCNRSLVEQGRERWVSLTAYDASMAVALADPRVVTDCPMYMNLIHTALGLGVPRPDQTRSVAAAEIPTADVEESLRIHQLRKERKEARKDLKGGVGDKPGGGGWLNL